MKVQGGYKQTRKNPPKPPHTGDSAPIKLVYAMGVIALSGMLFIIRRKREDEE